MTIYSRMGTPVQLTRRITEEKDIELLDHREVDDHDRERLEYRMYVGAVFITKNGPGQEERLFDLALLRADGGIAEINAAVAELDGEPVDC